MRINERRGRYGSENSMLPYERSMHYDGSMLTAKEACNNVKSIISMISESTVVGSELIKSCTALGSRYGDTIYADMIYNITRLRISPEKAKKHWEGIVRHMQSLNKKLGRNAGIYIAAGDYFANIKKYLKHPVLIEEQSLINKEEGAYRDGLTGLFNRRYFKQEIPSGIAKFRRFGIPFSLLMIDLDYFKSFNDKYGHQAGDVALKTVADTIGQRVRIYDRATRYGGDEFAIILHQTSRGDASIVAEKIRAAVEEQSIVYNGRSLGRATVSIGIATCPIDALEVTCLIRRADQALYVAKRQRNAVVAFCDYNRAIPLDVQERRLMAWTR